MRLSNCEINFSNPFFLLLSFVSAIPLFTFMSCSTPKNVTYFRDIPDTVLRRSIDQAPYYTPEIQVDDILQVTIQTLDPASTAMLNQTNTASWPVTGTSGTQPASNTAASNVSGFLVDKDGYVVLPLIGKVLVKGKTTDKVRDDIRAKAAEYYKDPVVNVRFANFKITVLGEVTRPSTYIVPNEKVTLLDAIGMAGDLTIYGKRENVMLIRDAGPKKEFIRFNLNDSKTFTSPYFYLRQGDVVYVEPDKNKVSGTDTNSVKRIAVITSVLTLLVVVISRINF
ncbi:polysaccharide biosynthesis/export family protein [Chitinophaga pinensis]|uniref:Periplasmic protein involved in polysaccharide export n=1 Tax=Chitinophaga pinensis (strain ATCC 43595 / DSM 2588 / LMG 13176 / NBRC 15968 / NCIMB 11800 / UQM 2034) TaxID=485918 RepID=A0A979G7G1_CHIPD|nr:polysaccharide biosynthesis/export family protein [Chitinophaga pinensis]ACU62200.1 periplasmic protein involved in polysaccharide export [Chitinophaga pinensis DSM 2588]